MLRRKRPPPSTYSQIRSWAEKRKFEISLNESAIALRNKLERVNNLIEKIEQGTATLNDVFTTLCSIDPSFNGVCNGIPEGMRERILPDHEKTLLLSKLKSTRDVYKTAIELAENERNAAILQCHGLNLAITVSVVAEQAAQILNGNANSGNPE